MTTETNAFDNATTKLIAIAVIVACIALGLIGLIVPLLPGLLFLGIAAVVAAKLSPAFERTLRQNQALAGYLDKTDGFLALSAGKKIQLVLWLGLKMLVDAVGLLVAGVTRLLRAVEQRP